MIEINFMNTISINESKEVNIVQTTSTAEEGGSDCEPLTEKDAEKQELLYSIFHCEKGV